MGLKLNKKQEEALRYLGLIKENLNVKWNLFKTARVNPPTKGGLLEEDIKRVLESHLGSRFDFYTKAQLIDIGLEVVELFHGSFCEVDVVATFKNTTPKLIADLGSTQIIPYDSVAFSVEVKSQLNLTNLNSDLEKFDKISKLPLSPNRFGVGTMGHPDRVDRPLRTLLYFSDEIDRKSLTDTLEKFQSAWDLILLIDKDELIMNMNLPIVRKMIEAVRPNMLSEHSVSIVGNSYVFFMILITGCVPVPFLVNLSHAFFTLMKIADPGGL